VYAAASGLQRGRVTALDAVEGLNVDANEGTCFWLFQIRRHTFYCPV